MSRLIPDEFAVSFVDPHTHKLVAERAASPVSAIWEIGRTLDAFWLERSMESCDPAPW